MVKNEKDIVKYSNELNRLNMSDLKEKELELFYAICCQLKNRGTDEIVIDITDFKKAFNISNKIDKKRFKEYIKSVHKKFGELKHTIETENEIITVIFFKKFVTNIKENTMIISVNKEYSYILNNIVQYYTQFSFKEYQSLKSKYSKILMPQLAQWNSIRKKEFTKEELFDLLGATKSYKNDISSFNKRILKPVISELEKVFYNLKVKPIKNTNGNSKNEINSYIFTWNNKTKKENIVIEAEEVKTIEISKKLKLLIDEATKNNKLEILEKPSVIEYLLKHYEENIIIQGIRNLLNSNLTTKIRTRKYLITLLDKIKNKENIIIVTKEDKKVEVKKEIEEYKILEKIEITKDEYNKLLDEEIKNYLEEAKAKNINVNLEITKMSLRLKLNSKYKIK